MISNIRRFFVVHVIVVIIDIYVVIIEIVNIDSRGLSRSSVGWNVNEFQRSLFLSYKK